MGLLGSFPKQCSHFVVSTSHLTYETYILAINKREKEKNFLSSKLNLDLYHSFSLYAVPHVWPNFPLYNQLTIPRISSLQQCNICIIQKWACQFFSSSAKQTTLLVALSFVKAATMPVQELESINMFSKCKGKHCITYGLRKN